MMRIKITYIDTNIVGSKGDKITHIYIKGSDESSIFYRLNNIMKMLDKEKLYYVIYYKPNFFSGYEKLHTFNKND